MHISPGAHHRKARLAVPFRGLRPRPGPRQLDREWTGENTRRQENTKGRKNLRANKQKVGNQVGVWGSGSGLGGNNDNNNETTHNPPGTSTLPALGTRNLETRNFGC